MIDNLLASLEELKVQEDYERISIDLSTRDLDLPVNKLYEYTQKLAGDNSIALSRFERKKPVHKDGTIINLERYLTTQKRIFEETI